MELNIVRISRSLHPINESNRFYFYQPTSNKKRDRDTPIPLSECVTIRCKGHAPAFGSFEHRTRIAFKGLGKSMGKQLSGMR